MRTRNFELSAFIVAIIALTSCKGKTTDYSILDFGAMGDGKTINTKAINRAVEECSKNGGGTVRVPAGIFMTGTVILLPNVDFHLDPGAVLTGSRDTSDYLKMSSTLFGEGYNRFGMICAIDARNISISGQGEINGNGTYFMNGPDKPKYGESDFRRKYTRQGEDFMKPGSAIPDGPLTYSFRPGLLITIERCEHVIISDVLLEDSPEWTIRLGDCDDADIRGISVRNNPLVPNNDGIHITTSRNVRISDCNVFAGDDAIIVTGFGTSPLPAEISSGKREPLAIGNKTGIAENVSVTNCVLSSRSACIRVGYGAHPIRNLVFSNLVMYDSNRGIGIFARDDSHIENVLFSNIIIRNRIHSGHWWGKGEPVHISAVKDSGNGIPGTISNIRFSDITAESEAGILIYGSEKSVIEKIELENVRLTINNGRFTESYGGNFDLRPAMPYEDALFSHDIPGLYAQYVDHLKVSNFELSWGSGLPSFFTRAIDIGHFSDVVLEDIKADPATPSRGLSAIRLSNGAGVEITNCTTSKGTVLLEREMVK